MTRVFTVTLAALTLLAQTVQAAPAGQTTILLPLKQAAKLYRFYFDTRPQSKPTYWTPSAAEVAAAEAALALYAKTPRPKAFEHPKTFVLAHYNRQYAGVVMDGKRELLINGFANDYPTDPQWRWRAVLVFDGGTGFFHGIYNPVTHRVEQLDFNGPG